MVSTHLGNHTFFFKHGHDTKWFFNKIKRSLKIHSEIFKDPIDAFFLIFFLFQNEHVMVEKLLKAFICVINTKLFKCIVLKDFETSNIQDTNEIILLRVVSKSTIDNLNMVPRTIRDSKFESETR